MGKRELLIIAAFLAVGALVYQLAAPATADAPQRFSLSTLIDKFHRDIQGNRAGASIVHRGTIPVTSALTELRISNINHAEVTGEARVDIAFELTVESNGPDAAAAKDYAERSSLSQDDVGPALSLKPTFPDQGRHSTTLSLRVPARLAAHIEGMPNGSRLDVSHLASVELLGVVGDARVQDIAGAVSGGHRNGHLIVENAGSVNLNVQSSDLDLTGIRGLVTLDARNGHTRISKPLGAVDMDANNNEVNLTEPVASVRIGGAGGHVTIGRPQGAVRVDMRRSEVEITVARSAQLTIFTTDGQLRLLLEGEPAMDLDALCDGGAVRASDFDLTAQATGQESRLTHTFGRGGARVALRNQRGEIVIARAK